MSCFQQSEGLPKQKLQLNSSPHINTDYVELFRQCLWEKEGKRVNKNPYSQFRCEIKWSK